jgi:hypothetical protein
MGDNDDVLEEHPFINDENQFHIGPLFPKF